MKSIWITVSGGDENSCWQRSSLAEGQCVLNSLGFVSVRCEEVTERLAFIMLHSSEIN
jgi:hypothetical protein